MLPLKYYFPICKISNLPSLFFSGCGSFSNVKLASSQTKQPGLVAIKIVSRTKVPESYLDRFLPRELKFWPKLNHPNIVKCHETFEELQCVYIVLEYVCNGDMMSYINNYGPLSEEKTKIVTKQVNENF